MEILMEDILKECPVVIEIPVAWGEMDAFHHVNNIFYFRYFESARIVYFEKVNMLEIMSRTGIGPILASTHSRFKIPLTHPDTVSVGARVSKIEKDRFEMDYFVLSHKLKKIAADGGGTIVSYNYQENKKAPLPIEFKQKIIELEGSINK
jgi:acyl-CoA thioester hydrolase